MNKDLLLRHLGIQGYSVKILRAFDSVRREDFIPDELIPFAYADGPLPLGFNSTISQPSTIAFMLNLLELENQSDLKILEIGSGCGYVLALMNAITQNSSFFGLEINSEVGDNAIERLKAHQNIKIFLYDGKNGLPEESPFDRILISAASESNPYHLLDQIKDSGIIVAPVLNSIVKMKKVGHEATVEEFPGFVFVPLL
ncbi:MAG: L-isoaspartyl protein carboxyl methyltransferase [Lentisphaerota bacterium]